MADTKKTATVESKEPSIAAENRLKKQYKETVIPALMKHFGYKNINQVPKLEKVVINMGYGDIKDNAKSVQSAVEELRQISGQKPYITAAKKSVANFKVKQGMNIGAKVTLRNDRMYAFTDKFISVVLPRVRDFKGVSPKSFDGRGNYTMGVKEQLIFPEIVYDQIEKIRGFDICFVTTAKTDEEAKELLKLLGLPFAK
ncbi:MAG: 50S ribosomal protein L5 [Clostridiales bacterium]|jgi:large subunit ribosomal protein L5|nr:50S ribosomal protein L5 [Clostridiales bacterium]